MVDVNINLKVPAVEKLIDYTASGVGAVAGPMLAPWMARQEAKVKLINAKAESDSLRLIAQAQAEARQLLVEPRNMAFVSLELEAGGITQRIEFQEKKRQANIAATVRNAAADLGDKEVPDQEPDPDWTARFFGCVQDVSSEDMRKLWAKVLSGEVQGPGSTSLRTLDVLRNLTAREATLFQEVCSYVIASHFVFKADEIQRDHPALTLDKLLLLEDAGLVNATSNLVNLLTFNQNGGVYLPYHDWLLRITPKVQISTVSVPEYALTSAGKELLELAECAPQYKYLKSFSRFLHSSNCELSYARITEELPDGSVTSTEFSPIEPDDHAPEEARP